MPDSSTRYATDRPVTWSRNGLMMCLQTVFLDRDDKSENGADGGTL